MVSSSAIQLPVEAPSRRAPRFSAARRRPSGGCGKPSVAWGTIRGGGRPPKSAMRFYHVRSVAFAKRTSAAFQEGVASAPLRGIRIARCAVGRLMRQIGLRRAARGRAFRVTTLTDAPSARPSDPAKHDFVASWPDQLWVAGITYVATWFRFAYAAFVVDAFSRAPWSAGAYRVPFEATRRPPQDRSYPTQRPVAQCRVSEIRGPIQSTFWLHCQVSFAWLGLFSKLTISCGWPTSPRQKPMKHWFDVLEQS